MGKNAPELLMRRFNPRKEAKNAFSDMGATIGESDMVTVVLKATHIACLLDVLENESKPQPRERRDICQAIRDAVTRWHSKEK